MRHGFVRALITIGVLGLLALSVPAVATATVTGGCTATGTSTSGQIDLTTEEVWHLKSTDSAGGSGTSPTLMTSAAVYAYALGLQIPVPGASGSGKGDTSGSVDNVSLSTFAALGKVFVVAGHATGDGASCDGQILIILDDVDALFTVLGGGGLIVFILGLAAAILTGRAGGCLSKIFALVFGAIGCTGLALSLEQFQVISPTSPVGLVIVLVGAILGFLVALRLGAPGMPGTTSPTTPDAGSGDSGDSGGMSKFDQMVDPAGHGTSPADVGQGAADMLGDAAAGDSAAGGSSSPGIAPTPDDVSKGAADLLGDQAGPSGLGGSEPPPPDPNAPGVDVGPSH